MGWIQKGTESSRSIWRKSAEERIEYQHLRNISWESLWKKCLWDQPCFVFIQSVHSGAIQLELVCGIALVQMEAEKEKMRNWDCMVRVDVPWTPSQPQIHHSLSSMSHGEPGKKHKLPRYFLGLWSPCVTEISTGKGALVKKQKKMCCWKLISDAAFWTRWDLQMAKVSEELGNNLACGWRADALL